MDMPSQNPALAEELAQAHAEIAALRQRLHLNSRHAKRIDQAYADARRFATWQAAGIPASRAYAQRQGISQNRWENALGLLRMARIVVRQRHWATCELTLIEARLAKAKADALQYPDAFRARLNRHAAR